MSLGQSPKKHKIRGRVVMNMKKVLGFTVSPRGSGGQGECPWPGQGVLGVEVRVRDSEAVVGIYGLRIRISLF
jgi:hypothetical protein